MQKTRVTETLSVTCLHKATEQQVGVLGDWLQTQFKEFEFSQITHEDFTITVQLDNEYRKPVFNREQFSLDISDRYPPFIKVEFNRSHDD